MSTSDPVAALLENRRRILAHKHWRATPELCAELSATNRAIKAATGGKAIKTRPELQPEPVRPETGDTVTALIYEDERLTSMTGVIIGIEWSTTFRRTLYRGRFEDGIHYFSSDAITHIEKGREI